MAHLDQILEDLNPENRKRFEAEVLNEEVMATGAAYCVHCRYDTLFVLLCELNRIPVAILSMRLRLEPTSRARTTRPGTAARLIPNCRAHAVCQRLRELKEKPYTQEEAEAAAGTKSL